MILNKQQNEAINAPFCPVLVVAGAGTGKTRVLISRIVHYINSGICPQEILAITFTNKARDEIKERVKEASNNFVPQNVYTFHGFFYRVLRRDINKLQIYGIDEDFRVLDNSDQKSIVRKIMKQVNFEEDFSVSAGSVKNCLEKLKNDFWDKVEEFLDNPEEFTFSNITPSDLKTLYLSYQNYLRSINALDYSDLEIFTYKLLKENEEARNYWSQKFAAILIDEFQDTSAIQLEIIKLLVNEKKNIFCVGDPDQSIYGFRGAKPNICEEYLDLFDNSICVKLEENYRSTKNILTVSNKLINSKNNRLWKQLFTNNEQGHNIVCMGFSDEFSEAQWVIKEIKKIIAIEGASLKDFVILYRNNSLSKKFEFELSKEKINFSITNALKFHEKEEIKIVVAYLNLIFTEHALESLERVSDKPSRGLGEKTLITFGMFKNRNDYTIMQAIENIEECQELKPTAKNNFKKFGELLKKLRENKSLEIKKLIDLIVKESGYEKYIEEKKELGRKETIMQFSELISEEININAASIHEILADLSLRIQEPKYNEENSIVLSTIHQSKGLEYKYVFLVKAVKGIFPSKKSEKDIEEETRLAYVAFTRAKKRLYVTYSPVITQTKIFDKESEFITAIKSLPCVSTIESPNFLKKNYFYYSYD